MFEEYWTNNDKNKFIEIKGAIYGLPEVHKPSNKMIPINNYINTATCKLPKWLTNRVKQLPKFKIKSSMKNLSWLEKLEKNDILVSYEMLLLFPSALNEKTLHFIK